MAAKLNFLSFTIIPNTYFNYNRSYFFQARKLHSFRRFTGRRKVAEPARKPNVTKTRTEEQSRRGLLSFGSRDGRAGRRQEPGGPVRGTLQRRRQQAAVLRAVLSQRRVAEAVQVHGQEAAQSVQMRPEVQLHVCPGQGPGQASPSAPELLPFVPGFRTGRCDLDFRLYPRAKWL